MSKESTAYINKLNYIKEYRKKNNKIYSFEVNKSTEKDIYDFLKDLKGRTTLIKRLIREEIARQNRN